MVAHLRHFMITKMYYVMYYYQNGVKGHFLYIFCVVGLGNHFEIL